VSLGFESLVKANLQVIGKIGKILQNKTNSRYLHSKEHIKTLTGRITPTEIKKK
jgi:hypothetical protein